MRNQLEGERKQENWEEKQEFLERKEGSGVKKRTGYGKKAKSSSNGHAVGFRKVAWRPGSGQEIPRRIQDLAKIWPRDGQEMALYAGLEKNRNLQRWPGRRQGVRNS